MDWFGCKTHAINLVVYRPFWEIEEKTTQNPSDLEAKVTKTNRNNKSKYNLSQKINKGHNALKFPYLFEYICIQKFSLFIECSTY